VPEFAAFRFYNALLDVIEWRAALKAIDKFPAIAAAVRALDGQLNPGISRAASGIRTYSQATAQAEVTKSEGMVDDLRFNS